MGQAGEVYSAKCKGDNLREITFFTVFFYTLRKMDLRVKCDI